MKRSTAFHEAGHSVVAVHLRAGLAYATLKDTKCRYGISDGHTAVHKKPLQVMGLPLLFVKIFKETSFSVETAERQHAKKQIVVAAAGREAQKLFASKITPAFLKKVAVESISDERSIQMLQRKHRIPESEIEILRRKAAHLVLTHRHAIHATARELLKARDGKVDAATIRRIYRDYKPSSPYWAVHLIDHR